MPDPSQLVVARVHGVAGRAGDLAAALRELAESSASQEGCLGFDVLAVPGEAAEFVLVTAWRDARDMRAHFASGAYGNYVSVVTDLLARPSDVTIHTISGTLHPSADLSVEPQRAS
jgi:quinol monooxygenase YgiN